MNKDSNVGLSLDHPILLSNIPVSYAYLRLLCSVKDGLTFVRIGAVASANFTELIDKYEILDNSEHFCFLFIYSYSEKNIPIVPQIFNRLNTNLDSTLFNGLEENITNEPKDYKKGYMNLLIDFIFLKNGILKDDHVVWTKDKENSYQDILGKMSFVENFESHVLEEWHRFDDSFKIGNIPIFKQEFSSKFHNSNLSRFTPDFIQKRNIKLKVAFEHIREAINRVQAWQDNEKVRVRIEINYLKSLENHSYISQITTPFITVNLVCDSMGRNHISYGLDANYLKMLPDDMASTLIRRIYEFTPGEMEPFVSILGFDLDCIKLFETLYAEAQNNNFLEVIEVRRNTEESINEMFKGLVLKDDIDDEIKKWFNR